MTWGDIVKRWWVYHEGDKTKRISAHEVKRLEAKDEDYQCILRSVSTGAEITRDDLKGERFQLYIPPSKAGKQRVLGFRGLEGLGLTLKNANSCERTYVFGADLLSAVAEVVGCRKRGNRPSRATLDAAKQYHFKSVKEGEHERVTGA